MKTKTKPITEVFLTEVNVNIPYIPEGIRDNRILVSAVFNKMPTEEDVYNSLCEDSFIQGHPLYRQFKETLRFCLDTWGMPRKTNHSFGNLNLTTLIQPWVANISESSKSRSKFSQDFGSISIRKKQIINLD